MVTPYKVSTSRYVEEIQTEISVFMNIVKAAGYIKLMLDVLVSTRVVTAALPSVFFLDIHESYFINEVYFFRIKTFFYMLPADFTKKHISPSQMTNIITS